MRPVILLFAKSPVPGRVKTRLQPFLSAQQAASLHDAFVGDALAMLETIPGVDVELHTDTSTDAWPFSGVARKLQAEGDLGIKMRLAAETALAAGRPRVLISGSDSPTLPAAHLQPLLHSAADIALGPSEDGGYYAIAFRRTRPRMFDGVPWSTPQALAATAAACRACGLSVETTEPWFDVDSPRDVVRLLSDPALRPRTAAWFAQYGPALMQRLACMR